ncbi:F-box/kelch-repeat protein At3g06240-like [Cornus florida]|uniref:F-box/kelch-repeat protein At3g06240-like n=1 Tax=Cornus florida TaxID=4283 RepID=UPI00289F81A8|nr:F-box/kelch-repeat protein At3g06240-like [Cornus florida]
MVKKVENMIQSSERSMPHLPLDVIIGILSKLPFKSLFQFRRVSKSWHTLISSSHFHQSITNANIQRQYMVMVNLVPHPGLYTASLGSADNDTLTAVTAVKIDIVLGYFELKHHVWTIMIGSCNGLLCFLAEDVIYIFNPITSECKKVPDPKFGAAVYGFGYDCTADDYKLVLGRKNNLHLYSLRSDSWKKIQDFPCSCSNHYELYGALCGASLNEAIHWFGRQPTVIVAFGFADEKFCEISVPTFPMLEIVA